MTDASGPAREHAALLALLRAVRTHRILVLLTALATLAGAAALLAIREQEYEATAKLLVIPLKADDELFARLPVARDVGDPEGTVETVAAIIDSDAAAVRTAQVLGGDWSRRKVAHRVSVAPLGRSNVIGVTALAQSPRLAARLANEFARAALALRARELDRALQAATDSIRAQIDALGPQDGRRARSLDLELTGLRSIADAGDPTLRLVDEADPPRSATSAGPLLVLALALLAGLVLGSAGAIAYRRLDPRVGQLEEAAAIFPVALLARVPLLPRRRRRRRGRRGGGWYMPDVIRNAFAFLVHQLADRDGRPKSVMVTSGSARDGKSTSAINLAVVGAASGRAVILVDLDVRRPSLARLLGVDVSQNAERLLDPRSGLADVVAPVPGVPNLLLLAAPGDGRAVGDALNRRLPELLKQARAGRADVVIDTPPLGEVSDALRVARHVDDILVVVREGHTQKRALRAARDLLEQGGWSPAGMIVLGDDAAQARRAEPAQDAQAAHVTEGPPTVIGA